MTETRGPTYIIERTCNHCRHVDCFASGDNSGKCGKCGIEGNPVSRVIQPDELVAALAVARALDRHSLIHRTARGLIDVIVSYRKVKP